MEAELLAALRGELIEERSRKSSLENRSLALAAAGGAAATLLLGLGRDYSGRWQDLFFVLLLIGCLSFLGTAFSGWLASRVAQYAEIDTKEFDSILAGESTKTTDELRRWLAEGVLASLMSARTNNDKKAKLFERSLRFLVIGTGVISVELVLATLDRTL